MKKILSLVLAMLMIFSIVPAAFAAETSADSTYAEALDFLAAVGFYKGGAGVADDDDITRWQMALFVSRLVTGEVEDSYWATTENDSGFTDVDALEAYMLGAVTFAAQEGIINGYGDGTFGPNDGITYRDALVMTVRALGTKYSASGYPWSYIATARELGLMDGITGIGWTDEITREVVAQILYNAFFAEVKGSTVATKVFGIAEAQVMVTASNRVVYLKGGSPVNATNYVQIMAVDEQLEPTGTAYHLPYATLGLKDADAANDAVGTIFNVWHRDNFKTVVMYENLNEVVTRRPGAYKFSMTKSGANARGMLINGDYTKLVDAYTNLFNQDRPDRTPAGDPEIKVYMIGTNNGVGGLQVIGKTYVMYPDGWIYKIADLTPVGYYSEFLDTWYKYTAADKSYTKIDITNLNDANYGIYADLHRGNDGSRLGFGLARRANTTVGVEDWSSTKFSAYADLTVTDADKDGHVDRAILKNYKIGQYFETKRDANDNSLDGTYFNIYTVSNDTTPGQSNVAVPDRGWDKFFGANGALGTAEANGWKDGPYVSASGKHNDNSKWNTDYRKELWQFNGSFKSGDYVIYSMDTDNDVLDVIKVIPKKSDSTTDTYWSTGYVLGFFQTQNKIYINDGDARVPLNIGYDDMVGLGSPLYSFNYNPYNNAQSKALFASSLATYLLDFVENEEYVKYLVLDGNVIAINTVDSNSGDYVIIDSYADISADGIKVNAWSTVTNQYDVITIAEFNGWDIDGVEWDALWQTAIYQAFATGKMPSMADLLSKYVPIEFGRVYAVVSSDAEKNYNITTRVTGTQNDKDVVVAGGYIHNQQANYTNYVKLSGTSANILETSATDFWLVKEIKTDADGKPTGEYKVYGRTGKLANVIFGTLENENRVVDNVCMDAEDGKAVTVYKADAASRDFVIEGTTEALASFLAQVDLADNSKVKYAVYEGTNMGQSQEDFEYNTSTYFRQTFRDVITGDYFVVDFDTTKEEALLKAVKDNRAAGKYNVIYKIVDGKLLSADPVDMKEVVAYVWAQKTYTKKVEVVGSANGETLVALLNRAVSELEVAVLDNTITNAQADVRDYIPSSNVTYVVLDNNDDYQYGIRHTGTVYNLTAYATSRPYSFVASDNMENAKAYIFYNDAATVGATKAIVFVDYGVAVTTETHEGVGAINGAAVANTYTAEITYSRNDNIPGADLKIELNNVEGDIDATWFTTAAWTVAVDGGAAAAVTPTFAGNVATITIAAATAPAQYTIVLSDGSVTVTYVIDVE